MSQPNKVMFDNSTNESKKIHPSEHPYVDGVYWWFEKMKLDAVDYEEESENQISWAIWSDEGFRVAHILYEGYENKVYFKSMVILGGIGEAEPKKIKEELLELNLIMPCLYRFSLDEENMIILDTHSSTEVISKGSYMSLIDGLLCWAERASDKLKRDGFSIDRRAAVPSTEEKKAG